MSVEVLRESACDCIHEIIMKGMEPLAKKEQVESDSLLSVLEKSSILEPQEVKWLFMSKRNIFVQDYIVASIRGFLHIPRGEWVNVIFV